MTAREIKQLHPESSMHEFELEWLMNNALGKRVIVEIGSYLGCSTRALAEAGMLEGDSIVFAVDDWYGPRDVEIGPLERLHIWNKWAEVGRQSNVFSLRMDHALLGRFRLHADMVFIDGAHDYESVYRDIKSAIAISNPDALICGHDFPMEGVSKAVRELLPNFQRGPVNLWYAKK